MLEESNLPPSRSLVLPAGRKSSRQERMQQNTTKSESPEAILCRFEILYLCSDVVLKHFKMKKAEILSIYGYQENSYCNCNWTDRKRKNKDYVLHQIASPGYLNLDWVEIFRREHFGTAQGTLSLYSPKGPTHEVQAWIDQHRGTIENLRSKRCLKPRKDDSASKDTETHKYQFFTKDLIARLTDKEFRPGFIPSRSDEDTILKSQRVTEEQILRDPELQDLGIECFESWPKFEEGVLRGSTASKLQHEIIWKDDSHKNFQS